MRTALALLVALSACAPSDLEFKDTKDSAADATHPASDAASDAGTVECTPDTKRNVACALCGTRTDVCTVAGTWELGECTNQGDCEAGEQQNKACGNCGNRTDTCSASCSWTEGECEEGECVPGTTEQGPCDACSRRTCGTNCLWGGCVLVPGADCHPGETRWCTCTTQTCPGPGKVTYPKQTCTSSCEWESACYCCSIQTGGCGLCV